MRGSPIFVKPLVVYLTSIRRYEVDGVKVILVVNFKKNQKIHPKEPESTLPLEQGENPKTDPAGESNHLAGVLHGGPCKGLVGPWNSTADTGPDSQTTETFDTQEAEERCAQAVTLHGPPCNATTSPCNAAAVFPSSTSTSEEEELSSSSTCAREDNIPASEPSKYAFDPEQGGLRGAPGGD